MIALLVALHLSAARLFPNCADAQADLLLVLIHLHNSELMLVAYLKLDGNIMLIHGLGDVA